MSDYYNVYPLKHFSATVAECMELPLLDSYAPPIKWMSRILKNRLGGKADRVLLYHADAIGMYIWQKYTDIFAPVYKHTCMSVPFVSTVMSVTPVAHASMYTGLDPEKHGIQTYTRPQLTCDTLYDRLIENNKRVAIVAMEDSTFLHIFKGRNLDYFAAKNAVEIKEIALELIGKDEYDLISIHTFEYDNASHAFGPESKEALNAASIEAENFSEIIDKFKKVNDDRHILYSYSPDHGQHLTEGGRGSHGSELIEDMNILHFWGTN